MSDHERIWLEPECCYNDYEGRMWSILSDDFAHNGDPDDDEHQKPTEYVRADLYAELEVREAAVKKDAAFYKCCARSGEYPKDGSEPSALECNRSKQMEKNDPRIKKVQKQYAQMKDLLQEVYQDGYNEGGKSVAALECKVDALMWEFCPDEITTEQWRNWARHQVPVSAKVEAEIDKALGQNIGR